MSSPNRDHGSGSRSRTYTDDLTRPVAIAEAVRARAEAYGRLPGDTRTLQQRMFDAAYDLLLVDADGGESAVPALDVDGVPVTIRVRGIEIQLLVPYSVSQDGELELAEIGGFGPLLPQAAREVLAQADTVRQIAVDAHTGEVLAVEDRLPLHRNQPEAAADQATESKATAERAAVSAPTAEPATAPEPQVEATPGEAAPDLEATPDARRCPPRDPVLDAVLTRMLDRPLQHLGPLQTSAYRASSRLLRAIRTRDRTCCFPGCTTPARWTDADHRDPWPKGPTSTKNMHCLCRRHHRAKQAYFHVEVDQHGNTIWTTPDGRRYTRPPPRF